MADFPHAEQARIRAHADQMRSGALNLLFDADVATGGKAMPAVQDAIEQAVAQKDDPIMRIIGLLAEIGLSEMLAQYEPEADA